MFLLTNIAVWEMYDKKFRLRFVHKEALIDLRDVVISFTPLSGFIDTAKVLNKWLLRRKMLKNLGRGIGRRYRLFVLSRIAKKYRSA
jgi:hypothetical protein